MDSEPVVDDAHRRFRFDEQLTIGKAQHMKAVLGEACRPSRVSGFGFLVEVLPAIEFDDELRFHTREVREENAYGMLSAELATVETSVAKA